jgi:hypothetical protein
MRFLAASSLALCSALALVTACGDNQKAAPDAQAPDAPPAPEVDAGAPDAMPPPPVVFVLSSEIVTINEGDAGGTVTVKLSRAPGGTVTVAVASGDAGAAAAAPTTLTFDDTSFDTEQMITVTAPDDADANNESVTVTLSAEGLADKTLAVTVIDTDALNILADPTTVTVAEGGTATLAVRLTVEPNADVTVNIANNDEGAATGAPSSLTFTQANYDQPQTVTVTGVQDLDGNDEQVVFALTSAGLTDVNVTVTVDDDDIQSIVAEPTSVTVDEGGTTTFEVRLTVQPNADVTVSIASDDEGAATATAALTFTPDDYDQPQTVTVTGVQDLDGNDEAVVFTVSSEGLPSVEVDATVNDEDVQSIFVDPTTLTVNEQDTATFSVNLTVQPNSDVTVNIASSDNGAASVSPASLTFTPDNYDQPQAVTVTGVNDADGRNESVTLTVSSTGLPSVTVDTSVVDNDSLNILADPTTVAVNEGGTGTFGVTLTVQPDNNVTVNIASGDSGAATANPTALTFTPDNYDQPQTVTVSGVNDADVADESVILTLSATGVPSSEVSVTVDDDDTQTIQLSRTSVTLNEGASATFTVRLSNDPLGSFDVSLSSSDVGGASVSPTSLTFNSGNYDQPQTVTVTGEADADDDDESVTITASGSGVADATVTVTVSDTTRPFPVDMFVRFSQPNAVDRQLIYQGDGIYQVDLPLVRDIHVFQIADLANTAARRFAINPTGPAVIASFPNTSTLTSGASAAGFILFNLDPAGTVRFRLDANNTTSPSLTVSRQ